MNYKLESALRDRSASINIFEALELQDNENIILPTFYLPKMTKVDGKERATDFRDCFVHTTQKIITSSETTIVSFIQLNPNGTTEDDTIMDIEQYVPNGFLVRLTCPQRNLTPEAVNVDYIVDMNKIYLEQATTPDGTKRQVRFRTIDIRNGVYTDGNRKVHISEEITNFNDPKSRQWLLRKYIVRK